MDRSEGESQWSEGEHGPKVNRSEGGHGPKANMVRRWTYMVRRWTWSEGGGPKVGVSDTVSYESYDMTHI